MTTNGDLAAAWAAALEAGGDGTADLVTPDAKVWHNHDEAWQPFAEAGASGPADVAFADVRAQATERGALVQATVTVGGRRYHVVQVLTVLDGAVDSVEEYVAPAPKGA